MRGSPLAGRIYAGGVTEDNQIYQFISVMLATILWCSTHVTRFVLQRDGLLQTRLALSPHLPAPLVIVKPFFLFISFVQLLIREHERRSVKVLTSTYVTELVRRPIV